MSGVLPPTPSTLAVWSIAAMYVISIFVLLFCVSTAPRFDDRGRSPEEVAYRRRRKKPSPTDEDVE